ncbi:hypothetical protein KsCSTR_31080 [Candidatus Kuenenia stuttgartiensis]|jgi:hypothetical protein|uniref:Uncharacterized protein n=1 Tax=Kuenenia stuttgartiensis TaxID=174633 RepID=Q1Q532_KUEST|nr:DUF1326 domain-containing protein [Candidatus Kuenenia stuttgartiensis]MBE7547074.1 DUF1326 domain-containing protein [Planctomycetia bacterium]QII12487.1 hypothetical protein KsCSTR_31080 [Candidatus Kuenenia stuttgartiensis]CAJ75113.1 unknown protein [Candidatus Kuenenia stuttgartiensis]
MRTKYYILLLILFFVGIPLFFVSNVTAEETYHIEGVFVEGCSCDIPCPCELISFNMGCQTVAALSLEESIFKGTDLTGVKIAYATKPGEWVRIYVDAKNEEQKQAAIAFAKIICAAYGKIESAGSAKIAFSGKGGNFAVTVDGGKIMVLTTEPVLGGDNATPVMHTNTKSKLNRVFMQGRVVSASFHDGERKFELKGSNAYFNTNMKCEGYLAVQKEVRCPLCHMPLEGNENTDYQITYTNGETVSYICPHCGLWEHAGNKDKIASVRARDFISGEWMDVSKMYMLHHSDAVPACSDNWIAFGKKDDAVKFQKGFGGKIYTFEEALEKRGKQPSGH